MNEGGPEFPQATPVAGPRPFGQVPRLWLDVTKMTEEYFAMEAPYASAGNALISVLILAAVSALLSAISSLLGGGVQMLTTPSLYEDIGVAPFLMTIGGVAFFSACYALVLGPIGFYLANGIVYIFARLLGGTGGFTTQVYLQSLFAVPLGILTSLLALLNVIPLLGGCISGIAILAVAVYSIVLNVRSVKVTHDFTSGRAVGAIFAPVLLLVGFGCLILFLLALMGPAIGNVFENIIEGMGTPMP